MSFLSLGYGDWGSGILIYGQICGDSCFCCGHFEVGFRVGSSLGREFVGKLAYGILGFGLRASIHDCFIRLYIVPVFVRLTAFQRVVLEATVYVFSRFDESLSICMLAVKVYHFPHDLALLADDSLLLCCQGNKVIRPNIRSTRGVSNRSSKTHTSSCADLIKVRQNRSGGCVDLTLRCLWRAPRGGKFALFLLSLVFHIHFSLVSRPRP